MDSSWRCVEDIGKALSNCQIGRATGKVRDSAGIQPHQPKATNTAGTPTQQHAMPPHSYVGQRLSFESALCTVRYVGFVQGTDKEWLGVEWDDPSRGKHDGEHKGVRYFSCESLEC